MQPDDGLEEINIKPVKRQDAINKVQLPAGFVSGIAKDSADNGIILLFDEILIVLSVRS